MPIFSVFVVMIIPIGLILVSIYQVVNWLKHSALLTPPVKKSICPVYVASRVPFTRPYSIQIKASSFELSARSK